MRIESEPSFTRLRTALEGGIPDRVPLAEITIDEGAKESFLGRPIRGLADDIEFYRSAGYDYITLGRRMIGFPPIWDAARFDNYYEVQRQVGRGHARGVICDWDDFRAYPWMRMDQLDLRILDRAAGLLPSGMKVIRYLSPVFQMTWMLMGLEQFCLQLARCPELIAAMMERIFELVWREVEDALERDSVGALWYGDDIAFKGHLMVPPAFLRQHFFPGLSRIGDACRRRGVPLLYHSDGDLELVLEDIIAADVRALHPIDPTSMNIYELKPRLQGRLCLIGNVDVDLLLRGTPGQVRDDTRRHLERLAPGGGYVLGSSNSIPRAVRLENYRAMLETALEFGGNPIQIGA